MCCYMYALQLGVSWPIVGRSAVYLLACVTSRSTDGEAETQKEFRTKLKAIDEAKAGKPIDDVCVQFGISKSQ